MIQPPDAQRDLAKIPGAASGACGAQQHDGLPNNPTGYLSAAGTSPEISMPERCGFSWRKLPPEAWIAAPLLAVLVGLLTAQVTLRFIFNIGVSWLEETIRIVFVWSMYFSFLVAAADNRHIRVALHVSAFPNTAQKVIFTLADLIWIGFNLTIVYFGTTYVLSLFDYPYLSPTIGINLAWVYMIVPLGFALLSVRVLINIVRLWRGDILVRDSRIDD